MIRPRHRYILTASIVSLLAISATGVAQVTWDGETDVNWNTDTNWDNNTVPSGQHAIVNTDTGNIATISQDFIATPIDIFVGNAAGTSGLLKHTAGKANTGNGNWMYVGVDGGTGVYDLADTTTTGGALTGLGLGSGSMDIGNTGTGGRLYIGGDHNGGGGTGTVNVNTSGTLTIRNDLKLGSSGGTGVMNVDAGTITTGGWNYIGSNENNGGGTGTFRMSGGSLTNTGRTYVGQSGATGKIELTGSGKYLNVNGGEAFIVGEGAGSNGQIIVNGANAELRSEGELWIGQDNGGNGSMIVSAGTVNVGNWLAVGRAGATGVLTINGTGLVQKTNNNGSLEITNAGSDTASGIVNLDGGTLRVNNITGSGGGGSTSRLFLNGGTLKPTINSTDFITGNVVTLVKNGGAVIDTDGFDITISKELGADTGSTGGLTKKGNGALTLSGASTYIGSTVISAGTLVLDAAGSINSSSGISLNGTNVKLVQNSVTSVAPLVTVATATLDGTGTFDRVTVTNGGSLTDGATSPGSLTIGTLTFDGNGTLNLQTTANAPVSIATTNLITGATNTAGLVDINVSNSNVVWTTGTYGLISYTTLGGQGFANIRKGTIAGLGARQEAALTNAGGIIGLTITGDLPVWTGAQNGNWTTAVIGGSSNWKLQTAGTPTDFLANDAVLFDDSATGTTTVTITANVNPAATTFNNTTKNYTVTSPGNFGITTGTLTKLGTGTLNLGGKHTYTGATSLNAGTTNLTGTLGNTAVTVAAGATLNVQAANAISQNTVTVNGTFTQTVDNALSGTAALVLNDGATLSRANTHSGGTTVNGGALNINNGAALGTGTFTIAGGTIDNTSGSPVTLTTNNPVRLASDLTFAGTNALNFGTGTVTLGNGSPTQTIGITNNSIQAGTSLTFGGTVSGTAGAAFTLNIQGSGNTAFTGNVIKGDATSLVINDNLPGTLTLSGAASSITTLNIHGGPSSIVELGAGNLTVANGGGSIVQSSTGGTINATGGGSIVLGSGNGDFGTAGGTTLTVNAKITGTNAIDFYNANGGDGLGSVVLTAANDYTGTTNVENTRVVVPTGGAINAQNTANVGQINVATVGNAKAVLDVSGGTINSNNGNVRIGIATGAAGALNVSSGTFNAPNEFWVGGEANSFGALKMTGGTINSGAWFVIGRNSNGTADISGGTLNVTNRNFITASTGVRGVTNLTGTGVINVTGTGGGNGSVYVGEAFQSSPSVGEINISGSAALNISGDDGIFLGVNGGGSGTVNFNGGTVTTFGVKKGGGTGAVNFDGGTLKARGDNFVFMQGLDSAYINDGGAIIDDGGFAIEIAQPLLAPTGNGVKSIAVSGGTGYVGAPVVDILGDGTGATAVANIDANGNLTGITITNPGVGYTQAPTVTLTGGGSTDAFVGTVELTPNVSGGFTKKGSGTTTLSGVNTYTGATVIEAGTLALTGSISGSTSITAKSGSTFDVSGVAGGFSLANGQTLRGNGTVLGSVAMTAGSKLAPGEGVGTLSVGGNLDLSLAVAATNSGALQFELGGIANSDKITLTNGSLNIGTGVLGFLDFAFTTIVGLEAGTYTLVDGNSAITGTLDSSNLTGSLGGTFTGTLGLADNGRDIVLTVIPEPGSATLLLTGTSALLGLRRFRRRSA